MRILRSPDHKRMPWKNGGGETVEVAVFPPEAGLGDFAWRVSMASVAALAFQPFGNTRRAHLQGRATSRRLAGLLAQQGLLAPITHAGPHVANPDSKKSRPA